MDQKTVINNNRRSHEDDSKPIGKNSVAVVVDIPAEASVAQQFEDLDDEIPPGSCFCAEILESAKEKIGRTTEASSATWSKVVWSLIFLGYNGYLVCAIYLANSRGAGVDWCDGVGFLIIVTGLSYLYGKMSKHGKQGEVNFEITYVNLFPSSVLQKSCRPSIGFCFVHEFRKILE